MSTPHIVTTAKVSVTIDVPIADRWGDECTIAQVYKQAEDVARGKVRGAFGIAATVLDVRVVAVSTTED